MASSEVINEMVQVIVRDFHPLRVILFGSHARGDAGPDSDVDLLVVLPHVENKREATVAMLLALADAPTAKDVVVTTPEEIERIGDLVGTILRPALREVKVLYEKDMRLGSFAGISHKASSAGVKVRAERGIYAKSNERWYGRQGSGYRDHGNGRMSDPAQRFNCVTNAGTHGGRGRGTQWDPGPH